MVGRWLRLLSAALGLGLAAGLGVFALSPADAVVAPAPRFERLTDLVPPPPGQSFFPLGRQLHLDARQREMGWALTDELPHKVADRYEAIWTSQGLEVRRHVSPSEQWVVAHDEGETEIRSVVVARTAQGRTSILASVSDEDTQSTQLVPRPAACRLLSSTGALDRGVRTEMALLDCRLGVDELLRFYKGEVPGGSTSVLVDRAGTTRDTHVMLRGDGVEIGLAMTQPEKMPPRSAVSVTYQREMTR